MSSDITWAFPTGENDINGTVHIDDIIVLQWIDNVDYPHWPILYCADGDPILVNTTATSSPFAFLFTTKVTTDNTTTCHFDFQNSSSVWMSGLSSAFTYNGTSPEKSTTWSLSVDTLGDTPSVSGNAGTGIATSTSSSATSAGTGTVSSATAAAGTSGLSTGADAGIGVGVGVGAILLALGALFYWRRRRSAAVDTTSKDYKPMHGDTHEMDGVAQERKELAATEKPQELEHGQDPKELEATERTMEPVELP